MPIYKITQKQGSKTITSTLESKSLASCKAFLKAVSTAKVVCIYKVEFEDLSDNIPIDDMNYYKQYKAFVSDNQNFTKQVLVHHVKPSINENEMATYIKANLEINGVSIKGLTCRLFMK
ncbi:hypothetical protein YY92_09015 [Campylobacter fetus]|uniref:hypothetical protein n=1 Tax=Campylobacter fetus TaxID=196 RepID=UPI0011CB514D|nr:hypothetical protein [Campylobacter fetus]EAJ1232662.1 hypothetical protein [Campylobacter fetus]EAK0414849.1 hypothetical protein [Campylobacter fetus]TXF08806.1 hypothetical protein FPD25_03720 [Campylobacter fetus subsp. fetus]